MADLGQGIGGWHDLFSDTDGINPFTGEAVTGVEGWDARFGSGAALGEALLTGGSSSTVKAAVKGAVDDVARVAANSVDNVMDDAGRVAFREAQGVYGADGRPLWTSMP